MGHIRGLTGCLTEADFIDEQGALITWDAVGLVVCEQCPILLGQIVWTTGPILRDDIEATTETGYLCVASQPMKSLVV